MTKAKVRKRKTAAQREAELIRLIAEQEAEARAERRADQRRRQRRAKLKAARPTPKKVAVKKPQKGGTSRPLPKTPKTLGKPSKIKPVKHRSTAKSHEPVRRLRPKRPEPKGKKRPVKRQPVKKLPAKHEPVRRPRPKRPEPKGKKRPVKPEPKKRKRPVKLEPAKRRPTKLEMVRQRQIERELERSMREAESARAKPAGKSKGKGKGDGALKRLGNWFKRQATKLKKLKRKQLLDRWGEEAVESRKKLSKRKRQAAEAKDRKSKQKMDKQGLTVEEYIHTSLQEAYDCLKGLGFKVDEPMYSSLEDGSYDAEIRINDPDDTTGAQALLKMSDCLKPVVGAYIRLGFRSYESQKTQYRVEKAEAGGKPLPQSLGMKEHGLYNNMTNYRVAGSSEIAAHVDALETWLRAFAEVNQSYCAQLYARYYYSPDGRPPR